MKNPFPPVFAGSEAKHSLCVAVSVAKSPLPHPVIPSEARNPLFSLPSLRGEAKSSLFSLPSLRANAFVFCERGNPSLSVQCSGQVLKQEAFQ